MKLDWENIYKSGFNKNRNKKKHDKGATEIIIKTDGQKILYDRKTRTGTFTKEGAPKHYHENTGYDKKTGKSFQWGGGENTKERSFNKKKKKQKKNKGRER